MKAFHNDEAVKAKYIARIESHIKADNLIRGTGWSNGKGCAVGCTLEKYDHAAYENELGIPEWLARVEDTLFEGMSEARAMTWPKEFLEAAHVGADLDKIKGPFLIFILESTLDKFDHAKFPDVLKAIQGSIALWKRDDIGSDDWKRAARAAAAAAAAWAAEAWAAEAWAAEAWAAAAAAAWAAEAARAVAAEAAAEVARAAAWAAEAAEYEKFAYKLLELMRGCKP